MEYTPFGKRIPIPFSKGLGPDPLRNLRIPEIYFWMPGNSYSFKRGNHNRPIDDGNVFDRANGREPKHFLFKRIGAELWEFLLGNNSRKHFK